MRIITKKAFLSIAILLMSAVSFLCSCSYASNNTKYEIDLLPFSNSKRHWYKIYDKNNVINARPNQPCYAPTQVKEIADNILLYQRDNGGWPKNYDMQAILTEDQKQRLINAKSDLRTTFDNTTTYSHIECLAKVYEVTKVDKYKDACIRGIDFTLSAQYPNGGWPQYFPLRKNYSRRITFNDNAIAGIMKMLKDIIDEKPYYSFLDSDRRQKAESAFDKGLDCILECQIIDNGKLTAWCQQHDENDFTPAMARAYELPSICNRESTGVVLFLMGLDNPDKKVINSVQSAVEWFEDSQITGIRVEEFNTPPAEFRLRTLTTDKRVIEDKTAPPIWARFYELKTHRPLFSNRKSQVFYSMADVDRERRAYGWYTYEPQRALDLYPTWQKKWAPGQNVLKKTSDKK